jgi:uncharacterized protein (TIGR02118 family)
MIKVSVMYPAGETTKFDMNYYRTKHMPMAQDKFGAACKGMTIEEGLAGGAPGSPPTYVAMGHFLFDSVADFQAAMAPHAATLMEDIPNYSNVQPVIQISEVKL